MMVQEPLGPRFRVQAAWDVFGIEEHGWVVTDRFTGLSVWTGMGMTMREAATRLVEHRAP
jgi:hypothetical protein